MPLDSQIKKVLMLGSGPIVIGQAAEFDYAGAQACRVLKQAGVNVVLVNSNPATIMTDTAFADEIYLEPLTPETIRRVILKEKPDSLLAGLGGQTGLTLAMQLAKEGFLQKHGVRLIGTGADAIDKAEDRRLFKETMERIGQPVIPSRIAVTVEEAAAAAREIGYPVILRPAFTLGGAGGGVARDEAALRVIADNALLLSPITQVLVERYIFGWKEIEFEVLRDSAGNVVAVCSMENVDPVGVHTGDSIVVAPALTLSDKEYQLLRSAALSIISELKVEGGCNCQFALNPDSFEYAVIEVNPRVSRSSALASKATGYPIAKVATKIALGYTLPEIENDVTGKTCACFEPTLDYVVVKLPKWPFDKFPGASRALGTQMKATGEVMAIAPSFEMALMKAVRGAELKLHTLDHPAFARMTGEEALARAAEADDLRLFALFRALKAGVSVERLHAATRVDRFFLEKLRGLAEFEARVASDELSEDAYLRGKRLGYTDDALFLLSGAALPMALSPAYRMVDTCAGEFQAKTPYFYATYDERCESRELRRSGKRRVLVLGSGPIRIGQGIEFDYSSVHCVWTLKALGFEVALINNNPETVSTDFDTADRLYFEPLSEEDVLGVCAAEQPEAVVVAFGGQTAINLVKALSRRGIPILGTSAEGIDTAEDRGRFDALLRGFGIRRPEGLSALTMEDALAAAARLGYPVLLRPSYVIGGQNMTIAHTDADVQRYMARILAQKIENPVLVDKYLMGKELEVDVISDGQDVLLPGVMEHVERAGVHSGDSIAVYPPYSLTDDMLARVVDCSTQLALALGTRGLVNIQYLIYEGELYVIEVNPRASRTIPYLSKVTGVPMVDVATRVMTGAKLSALGYGVGLYRTPPYTAVKVPVFSFEKLNDVNASLSPEMKSTGEALGIGRTLEEALFKGLLSAGFELNREHADGALLTLADEDKGEALALARRLREAGLSLYATEGTARALAALSVPIQTVLPLSESDEILDLISAGFLSHIVYTGAGGGDAARDYIRMHRHALLHGVACMTSMDTAMAVADILCGRFSQRNTELVDVGHLRAARAYLPFVKMQATGDDYILFDNRDGQLEGLESLAVTLCDRRTGVGGAGVACVERSDIADAKLRVFNRDGTEAEMAGNAIRCVAKFLYDTRAARRDTLFIETRAGTRQLTLTTRGGEVSAASVDMGEARLAPAAVPVNLTGARCVNAPVTLAGERLRVTCLSVGNPHCVLFCDALDTADVAGLGARIERDPLFPERANVDFVRVTGRRSLSMRAWERGSGETAACGTGACAAAMAAVLCGLCDADADIRVKASGGELVVRCEGAGDGARLTLTGDVTTVFEGRIAM